MREIIELAAKIPPLVETTLSFLQRNTQYFPAQDVVYNLQMSYYWWKEAAQAVSSHMDGTIVKDGPPINVDYSPTLMGPQDQLNYLSTRISELARAAVDIKDDALLPPRVGQWVENGITTIMMAKFNVNIIQENYGKHSKFS